METSLWTILVGGVLLNNYALQGYLGVSTLLGASKETVKAAVMGAAVTVAMVLTTLVAWPVQNAVLAPMGLEYLQTLVFAVAALIAACVTGTILEKGAKKPLGAAFPLLAVNSAVLGAALQTAALTFVEALVTALAAGLGFLLALVVFAGVRSRIEENNVPKAFRGLPIYLMTAAILSLALFAF